MHFDAYPPNRIIALHAEDEGALRYFVEREQTSSPLSAEIAMTRAIAMAADLQRRVHICHIATAREIELVRQAKTRGHQVTCEVTPHHLFLSTEIDQHLGALGRISPPLRTKDDADALWDNLKWIDCIGSDHTPYTVTDKQNKLLPEGVPGLESMLSVLLTAVHQQLMSYADLVRLTSAGPAKLFGLADKGRIQDGAHADLVIVNPAEQGRIEASKMHSPCGWTPFEGWRTRGKVEQVFLRGRAVFKDGKFNVESGYGQRVRQVGAEMDWWRIET